MPGDWFLDIFTSAAEKLVEYLGRDGYAHLPDDIDLGWWIPGLPEVSEVPRLAAVDGGAGIIQLEGGASLYIARAFGYVEDGEPERDMELRLYPVRDARVLDMLRTWVEHRTARRMVYRLPKGSILFMDGSMKAVISTALSQVLKLHSGPASSLTLVYAGLLASYVLIELVELVAEASRRGVLLAYVSKDHRYTALKEKVLLEHVASRAPETSSLVRAALEWYPLAARDQLVGLRRILPARLRRALDAALDRGYTDSAFIGDVQGPLQGYTYELTLPPPLRVARLLSRKGQKELAERLVEKASALAPGEVEEAEFAATAPRLSEALPLLPQVRLTYARLGVHDAPLLIELPGPLAGFYSAGRELREPGADVVTVVSALRRSYAGPAHYNVPLVAAHVNATLDSRQLASYARLLEHLSSLRGYSLKPARRAVMGRTLRRRSG
ncbi:MAG: DNA double-strand break repair nuclease NurA [Thermoproteota archaeon]